MDMSAPAENNLISAVLPEVCYPDVNAAPELAPSPISEFLADEEAASTCPLHHPSVNFWQMRRQHLLAHFLLHHHLQTLSVPSL